MGVGDGPVTTTNQGFRTTTHRTRTTRVTMATSVPVVARSASDGSRPRRRNALGKQSDPAELLPQVPPVHCQSHCLATAACKHATCSPPHPLLHRTQQPNKFALKHQNRALVIDSRRHRRHNRRLRRKLQKLQSTREQQDTMAALVGRQWEKVRV